MRRFDVKNGRFMSQRLTNDDENPLSLRERDRVRVGFSDDKGVTLIELMIVLLILSIIAGGLSELLAVGLTSSRENRIKTGLIDDANYAMNRIINVARETNFILIPQNAPNPVRDIFAVSAMIDNDNDGKVDEDWSSDIGNDGKPGLAGFDDDGDGSIDEGGGPVQYDDDEDGPVDEDIPKNGLDDELDGNYDEEFRADMDISGQRCPPGCSKDDDGDGMTEEDPVDPRIFYVNNGSLYEKKIVWNPATGTSIITDSKLIDNVSQFRVERLLGVNGKTLIKIRIELATGKGNVMLESEAYPRMIPAVTP